jgi:hypothetical protein
MTAPRRALIGFMLAFAIATVIAALTTIRQVRMETSSAAQPTVSSSAEFPFTIAAIGETGRRLRG